MQQVFVINPKGGCGKTMIATHLCGFFANNGRNVLLVDHDIQKSGSDWLASRPSSCAPITSIAVPCSDAVDAPVGTDVVIHDMPAAYPVAQHSQVIGEDDSVLIPVLPSPTDIKACLRYVMSLDREGMLDRHISVGLIANRVRSNTCYYGVLKEFLTRLQIPLVGELRDTQKYIRLTDRGLSMFDVPESHVQSDRNEWRTITSWLCQQA